MFIKILGMILFMGDTFSSEILCTGKSLYREILAGKDLVNGIFCRDITETVLFFLKVLSMATKIHLERVCLGLPSQSSLKPIRYQKISFFNDFI